MIKNIVSNDPTRDSLQQILEALKGKCGSGTDGDKWIMGINLSSLERRIAALEGGHE
jgi:hypothetical protein